MKAITDNASTMDVPVGARTQNQNHMSDKKQQVINLQNEQRHTVANCRLALAKSLDELQEFGGKDLYKPSVSIIASGYGDEGVLMMRLRELLPDATDLNKVIAELKAEREVEEVGKGRKTRLKSLRKPQPPEAQPHLETPSTNLPSSEEKSPTTKTAEAASQG